MKCFCLFFFLLISISPGPAWAFLADSDPPDFFTLAERSSALAVSRLNKTRPPEPAQRYFIHEVRVQEALVGNVSGTIPVFEEILFPNAVGAPPRSGDFLLFLAPLPNFTAFAPAKQEGVEFRIFGGAKGVWPLSPTVGAQVIGMARDWMALRGRGGSEGEGARKDLLLKALTIEEERINNDAAVKLASLSLGRGFFSTEDFQKIEAALASGRLKPESQTALVRAIAAVGDAGAQESLKRIAAGGNSPAKWAAVQALEGLGVRRSVMELQEDFLKSNASDKDRIVGMLAGRQDPEARAFLKSLLSGNEELNLKREVLEQMARIGGSEYEAILIEQTQNRDEQVAMQAIVALGGVTSEAAWQKILSLLNNPSPKIRGAAGMALMRSKDPRAAKVYHERFEEQGYGHFHR